MTILLQLVSAMKEMYHREITDTYRARNIVKTVPSTNKSLHGYWTSYSCPLVTFQYLRQNMTRVLKFHADKLLLTENINYGFLTSL